VHADLKTENVLLTHPGMTLDDEDPKVSTLGRGEGRGVSD